MFFFPLWTVVLEEKVETDNDWRAPVLGDDTYLKD